MFGNNFGPPLFASYVLGPTDLALSQAMSGYWTRFAATGNPNLTRRDGAIGTARRCRRQTKMRTTHRRRPPMARLQTPEHTRARIG